MSLEAVEKEEAVGKSTGFSIELMGNNDRPSPLEGIYFMVVQIPMLADGKRK
jgi:hypothetical protein